MEGSEGSRGNLLSGQARLEDTDDEDDDGDEDNEHCGRDRRRGSLLGDDDDDGNDLNRRPIFCCFLLYGMHLESLAQQPRGPDLKVNMAC